MRIISRRSLRIFWERHPSAEQPLKAWYKEAEEADWSSPADVKSTYGTASVLKGGRVVFNIAGNKYRLVVKIEYKLQIVFIRFVGTHEEYDEIDAETI